MNRDNVRGGAVVAFWHGGDLAFAVVGGEEKQRIRLVLPGGREERVKAARIAAEVVPPGDPPGTTLEDRRRAGERARAVAERVRAQAEAVDVGLLWEIVSEGLDPGTAAPRADLRQLAELALESPHGDARTAVMIALRVDGLHFARKGDDWEPRSGTALAQLLHQRETEVRRREEETAFFEQLAAAMRGAAFTPTGSKTEGRFVDALEQFAIFEDDVAEPVRATALAALDRLKASGARFDRPHEGAFRASRALGRFSNDDCNLQVLRYRLEPAFAPELVEEAVRAAEAFASGTAESPRIDRREEPALSIDSAGTREIDDLLFVEPRDDGGFRIAVHIADPTPFVAPGSPLDREALARGLTRYMPDVRVLMLPTAISEEAASLTVGDERPAVTYDVALSAEGEIESFGIAPSLVRSAASFGYDEADAAMRAPGKGDDCGGDHAARLAALGRFGTVRQGARRRRGALVIDAPEVDVKLDTAGRPYLERGARDSPARRAVTEAMVLVGEVAARYCLERGLPAIYRRQAAPAGGTPDDIVRDPAQVRAVRRSLRRADTGLSPGLHASLGLEAYAQVTSPLRRYQDLATLRQILADLAGAPPCYDAAALRDVAATTDRAELEARRAERSVNEYWLLRVLESRTGETVAGRIVETQPRPVVQLVEALREQPMPALAGEALGAEVELVVDRVNPRAGLLVLRKR